MAPLIPGTITAENFAQPIQQWKKSDQLAQKSGNRAMVFWVHGEKYKGQWENNQKSGSGTQIYRNGDKYEGQWKKGKRHGLGTQWRFVQGRYVMIYNGEWAMDQPFGEGTFVDDGGNAFEGKFINGKREGKGRQTYVSYDEAKDIEVVDQYEGEWLEDKRHGQGVMEYGNGCRYEGGWYQDVKQGDGVYYDFVKKKKYVGIWVNGVPKAGEYQNINSTDADVEITLPPVSVEDAAGILGASETLAREQIAQIEQAY